LVTADLLGASELVFFVRGQGAGASLAFKFEADSVFFAHTEFDGFEAGFSAFDLAPAIEDHTEEVRALEETSSEDEFGEKDKMRIFTLAASGLLQIAEGTASGDAVLSSGPPRGAWGVDVDIAVNRQHASTEALSVGLPAPPFTQLHLGRHASDKLLLETSESPVQW